MGVWKCPNCTSWVFDKLQELGHHNLGDARILDVCRKCDICLDFLIDLTWLERKCNTETRVLIVPSPFPFSQRPIREAQRAVAKIDAELRDGDWLRI